MRFTASPMSLSVSDAISGHIKEIESQFFFTHSLVMLVALAGKNFNGRKRSAFPLRLLLLLVASSPGGELTDTESEDNDPGVRILVRIALFGVLRSILLLWLLLLLLFPVVTILYCMIHLYQIVWSMARVWHKNNEKASSNNPAHGGPPKLPIKVFQMSVVIVYKGIRSIFGTNGGVRISF